MPVTISILAKDTNTDIVKITRPGLEPMYLGPGNYTFVDVPDGQSYGVESVAGVE